MPAIEASERDGKYVVRAELPGLKPEEVKLVVKDNMLVLDGERKLEREEDRGGIHRTEIRYGKFHRVVPIPEGADVEQAKARFDNGVLEVTVPLPAQESRRREIPIEANSQQPAEAQKQG
jgi:HSP20 family protein